MRESVLDRREFLKSLGVGAVIALVPFACSKQEQTEVAERHGQTVYTEQNPGPWRGKEAAHLPRATLTKLDEAGNFRVDVVVHHEMNPQKPHWIQTISLKDQDDRFLAEKNFEPTDPKAEASFEANAAHVHAFKVYSLCNIHGLWLHEYRIPA